MNSQDFDAEQASASLRKFQVRLALIWIVVMFVCVFAEVEFLRFVGKPEPRWAIPVSFLFVAVPVVPILFYAVRKGQILRRQAGMETPTIRKYQRYALPLLAVMMAFYVPALILKGMPDTPKFWLWLLAMPVVAILMGAMWLGYRQFAEETDEYVKQRALRYMQNGMVFVLTGANICAMLQFLGLVGKVNAMWVLYLFLIGGTFGRWRERRAEQVAHRGDL